MKKVFILLVMAAGLILLANVDIALAVDDATVQQIQNDAANAKNKADGNDSKITGLYDNIVNLQNQIDNLKNQIDTIILTPGPEGPPGADVTVELCDLYELTGKLYPLICKNCGNGNIEPKEECDDSNTEEGDGCNSYCMLEGCGNGRMDIGEECDDGNAVDRDGCSSACKIEYRKIFITSQQYSGDLGGLEGADAICNDLAFQANLPGTYMAWLSADTAESPETRMNKSQGPYVLVDGTAVADNWSDLVDGTLDNPIYYDELGNYHYNQYVWTGTYPSGKGLPNTLTCNGWTTTEAQNDQFVGTTGNNSFKNWAWTRTSVTGWCWVSLRLYCIEQ